MKFMWQASPFSDPEFGIFIV